MYFILLLVREICKLGSVAYLGEFYKLGENLSLQLENASYVNLFCYKNTFLWSINM